MSMKSHFATLAAMAMMAAQGGGDLFSPGYGYPPSPKAAPKKCDQKKCKSCKKFVPGSYKGSCPKRSICDPWAVACSEHQPKRKK